MKAKVRVKMVLNGASVVEVSLNSDGLGDFNMDELRMEETPIGFDVQFDEDTLPPSIDRGILKGQLAHVVARELLNTAANLAKKNDARAGVRRAEASNIFTPGGAKA